MSRKEERKRDANEAINKGIEDFYKQKTERDCPYPRTSVERGYRLQGFRKASKHDKAG